MIYFPEENMYKLWGRVKNHLVGEGEGDSLSLLGQSKRHTTINMVASFLSDAGICSRVEVVQSQVPSMTAESLLTLPWGNNMGQGLAWNICLFHTHTHFYHCSRLHGLDNSPNSDARDNNWQKCLDVHMYVQFFVTGGLNKYFLQCVRLCAVGRYLLGCFERGTLKGTVA
jgi:hypothetical protein